MWFSLQTGGSGAGKLQEEQPGRGGQHGHGMAIAWPQPSGGRKPAPVCGSRTLRTVHAKGGHCQQVWELWAPLPSPVPAF